MPNAVLFGEDKSAEMGQTRDMHSSGQSAKVFQYAALSDDAQPASAVL
ncbi:MAG: hypothetical protein J6O61_13745 [Butyrivibrio sp.]|nr:hypothetical protein [Butyrivibrio sp.]